MKNGKSEEVTMIRSKVLAVLFSMLVSALVLLPLFSNANNRAKKANSTVVQMKSLEKDYHVAINILAFEEGRNSLTIESLNGETLYYDRTISSNEPFTKVFDFSNLEDGNYVLKVKSKNGVNATHFEISNNSVNVYNKEEAPILKIEDEKAFFELPNTSDENYSIEVLDEAGNRRLYTNGISNNNKKVINFSQTEPGKYQILVSSPRNTYAFNFEK